MTKTDLRIGGISNQYPTEAGTNSLTGLQSIQKTKAKKTRTLSLNLIGGVLIMLLSIIGCSDSPHLGSMLTVDDVDRYFTLTEDSVCLQHGVDLACITIMLEQEATVDENGVYGPIVQVHPTRLIYVFYREGVTVLPTGRATDTGDDTGTGGIGGTGVRGGGVGGTKDTTDDTTGGGGVGGGDGTKDTTDDTTGGGGVGGGVGGTKDTTDDTTGGGGVGGPRSDVGGTNGGGTNGGGTNGGGTNGGGTNGGGTNGEGTNGGGTNGEGTNGNNGNNGDNGNNGSNGNNGGTGNNGNNGDNGDNDNGGNGGSGCENGWVVDVIDYSDSSSNHGWQSGVICGDYVEIDETAKTICFTGADGVCDPGDTTKTYYTYERYWTYAEASERAPEILVEVVCEVGLYDCEDGN